MRFATAVAVFIVCLLGTRAEIDGLQILTRSDLAFTSPWTESATTLTYGNWNLRLDPDLARTQLVQSVAISGEAGDYNLWTRMASRNFATNPAANTGPGTIEFRFGSGPWSNAVFSTSFWQFTNYVASSAFTNIDFRFTQPHPLPPPGDTVNNYDVWFEGIGITTNKSIKNDGDMFLDYSLPEPTPTNQYVGGNLLYNSSLELGFNPWWMFDRQGPTASNEFKATFLDQAVYRGDSHTGTACWRIRNDYVRYAFYYSPIVLRPGIRQYTLSWWARTTTGYKVLIQNISPTNSTVPVNATNRGYEMNFTATGSNWVRVTTNFWLCDRPTPEWELRFSSLTTANDYDNFDDIMLEEGGTPSAQWRPNQGVEWVILPRRCAVYSETEPINLQLVSVNYGGSSSNLLVRYTAYNSYGTKVFSGEFEQLVGSGLVTNTISVPRWIPYGAYRIQAHSPSHPASSECLFSKILYPDAASVDGVIQLHGHPTEDASRTNVALGFGWMRSLSPGNFFRVGDVQPTEGVFDFSLEDWAVNGVLSGGSKILASLWMNTIPSWWATPSTAMPTTNRLADYITAIVSRYAGRGLTYEHRNEPANTTPPHLSTNDLATCARIESEIIDALDPGAQYIALGGMDNASRARDALTQMDSNTLARIDGISCHLYPKGGNPVMHMQPDNTDRNRYMDWRGVGQTFGKPVWNTESGQWDIGLMRGRQVGYMAGATLAYACLENEDNVRASEHSISRQLSIGARSIGHGFAKWFLYDGRFYSYRAGNETEASSTIFDYYDSVRAHGAAIMTMKRLVDPPTFTASVTNLTMTEAYVVAKGGRTFVMVWTQDKTNRTITLGSTNYGVLDQWGNFVQTNQAAFLASKRLCYLVSDLISTNTMVSLLATSGVVQAADVTPPIVSIDEYPIGSFDGANSVAFKTTVWDDTQANTPYYRNRVLTQFRTRPIASWSDWSEKSIYRINGLQNGPHRFEVQAKDFYNNTSSTAGLSFTITNGVVVQWETFNTGSATANNVIISN